MNARRPAVKRAVQRAGPPLIFGLAVVGETGGVAGVVARHVAVRVRCPPAAPTAHNGRPAGRARDRRRRPRTRYRAVRRRPGGRGRVLGLTRDLTGRGFTRLLPWELPAGAYGHTVEIGEV